MRLAFVVLGEPVGKGRPRAVRQGAFVRMVTPTGTREYEHLIAELGAAHAISQKFPRSYKGPCGVTIDAVFTRPKNRYRKVDPEGRMVRECGRIDGDNVLKAILDGLQNGGVYKNDSQAADIRIRLWWTAHDEAPCVEVEVITLDGAMVCDLNQLPAVSPDKGASGGVRADGGTLRASGRGSFR